LCHNTRLTDDDTGTDSNAVSLIVNNVDPVITALASDATFADKAEEGETVTVSGAFTDVVISACVDGCGHPWTALGDLRIRRLGIRVLPGVPSSPPHRLGLPCVATAPIGW
jgi:hypothetical protein